MSKSTPNPPVRRRNLAFKLRPILRWITRLRSTPHAIAGGLALGTFVSLTPTVGIQFFIVVIIASLLNLNRAAAIIPIWITNPVTIAPIYTFNYWIGLQFVDGPPVKQVSELFLEISKSMAKMQFWEIKEQFNVILHTGREVILPLTVGSVLVGLVCGGITWGLSISLLKFLNTRRRRKNILY
ncbi:DUF2062 domain-containing protein [Desulforhopalus vacuolatus]|uniref:DUF2062 domain-containing protein n=1 Tax=Desulforhopalus vacuolatus TaxID=40414 RepID=UPI001964A4D1|nr:DUF2062 domain-containing protein [Desulforhopalus vacuolatus]MBM9519290.1 DUF2062 domain-containing protein [Desulforhopalus vacuolatus]